MAWTDQAFKLADEATWGVVTARTEQHGVHGGSALSPIRDKTQSGLITGVDLTKLFVQQSRAEGVFEGNLVYTGMRELLAFLMNIAPGDIVDAGAGPYTHTYQLAGIGPGWTVELDYDFPDSGEEAMIALGCKCQNFSLNFTDGQEVLVSANFNGKSAALGVPQTGLSFPDYDSETIEICHISVEVDDVAAPATAATIEVDHGITSRSRLNGSCALTQQQKDSGQRVVQGTLTCEWDDKTIHDLYANDTRFKLGVIGTGSGNRLFTALLNNCEFRDDPINVGDGGIVTRTLNWQAFRDDTYSPLQIEVQNDSAAA